MKDFVENNLNLIIFLWFLTGFLLSWVSVFIRQRFYRTGKVRSAGLFDVCIYPADWAWALFFSILWSYGGPAVFFRVYEALDDIRGEKEDYKKRQLQD